MIKEKGFSLEDLLTEEESKAREKLIDQAGVDAMYAALTDIPFFLEVVGSEGRKHIHQYGEAMPTLEGTFGSGDYRLDMVNDVVEGSKAAKLNSPGAVSVIAVSSHKGLMATPAEINVVMMDRDRNAHYINACQKFGVNLILIKPGIFYLLCYPAWILSPSATLRVNIKKEFTW